LDSVVEEESFFNVVLSVFSVEVDVWLLEQAVSTSVAATAIKSVRMANDFETRK
jgi:hypothetical protein